MLAGEPPFGGTSLASVLSRKLTQAAPSVRSPARERAARARRAARPLSRPAARRPLPERPRGARGAPGRSMTDEALDRLADALADRYLLEEELGRGASADGLSRPGPAARAAGRAQGAALGAGRGAGRGAVPAGDPDPGAAAPSAHPAAVRLGAVPAGRLLLRHAVRGDAARSATGCGGTGRLSVGAAVQAGAGGGVGAELRPRARGDPPRPQAREHPASPPAATPCSPTSASPTRSDGAGRPSAAAHRDRRHARHARPT